MLTWSTLAICTEAIFFSKYVRADCARAPKWLIQSDRITKAFDTSDTYGTAWHLLYDTARTELENLATLVTLTEYEETNTRWSTTSSSRRYLNQCLIWIVKSLMIAHMTCFSHQIREPPNLWYALENQLIANTFFPQCPDQVCSVSCKSRDGSASARVYFEDLVLNRR